MKNLLKLYPILFFLSCAEEFVPENPIDPDNPSYIPPIVSIVDGITIGEIVTSENLSIEYSGNESSMLFRTRLDTSNWTGWSNNLFVTLDYMDEGEHEFWLQGKYTTGDTSETISVPFTVDAVGGPSLMFFPRRITAIQGETVTFSIMAEEVYDLAGLETVLEFDPAKVTLMSVSSAGLFDETGDPIFFYEHNESQGRLTITAAVWGDESPAFTGTHPIAIISFRADRTGNIAIDFGETSIFRDPNNLNITVWESIPGLIAVN